MRKFTKLVKKIWPKPCTILPQLVYNARVVFEHALRSVVVGGVRVYRRRHIVGATVRFP